MTIQQHNPPHPGDLTIASLFSFVPKIQLSIMSLPQYNGQEY